MSDRDGCEGIIQDVVMLGTPVTGSARDWAKLERVVAGRIVNGYCKVNKIIIIYKSKKILSERLVAEIHVQDVFHGQRRCRITGH